MVESNTFNQSPEAISAIWHRLESLARSIRDDETRVQYLAAWRARFEREFPTTSAPIAPLHALTRADDGDYVFPESENDSEARLHQIVRHVLRLRQERRGIADDIKDALGMAKAIGFDPKALNAVMRDIEADSAGREDHEALWALYRRVIGVRGPMQEAIMPPIIDARPARALSAPAKRLSHALALVEAGRDQ